VNPLELCRIGGIERYRISFMSQYIRPLKVSTYAGFDIFIFLDEGTLIGMFFVCPENNNNHYLSRDGINSRMGEGSWCESYKEAVKLINSHLMRKIPR